uniref:Uncharacterized protein n=1 Tax=Heterorhabditis bacteriophora TaxID=37862 RepID=A0A1I7WHD6_HETBA
MKTIILILSSVEYIKLNAESSIS